MFPAAWLRDEFPTELAALNDSKQLSETQREHYFTWLTAHAEIRFAVAQADAPVIDRLNILQATHRAMNDALAQLAPPPAHVLVDGLRVKSLHFPRPRWSRATHAAIPSLPPACSPRSRATA